MTSPSLDYPEIFDIVLYGYAFYSSTKELFHELLKRFRISPPFNLSPSEK